ncbi:hypothetical protein M885DRAFT_612763 [Pelagophyceae sp. CCMP2097]|nr:hypothetical protein M885DRAFT_612763 [Pelagophyceae sp. CCMP2097]
MWTGADAAGAPPRGGFLSYVVKAGGLIVRSRPDLASARVADLDAGVQVLVAADDECDRAAADGRTRIRISKPTRGWVSFKRLDPYGTKHAMPPNLRARETAPESRKIQLGTRATLGSSRHDAASSETGAASSCVAAEALIEKGDLDAAEAQLRALLLAAPRDEDARLLLARVAQLRANRRAAMTEAERRTHDARALKARADANFAQRNWRSAAEAYGQLVSASGAADAADVAKLYANRSACRARLQQWSLSLEDAQKCVGLAPEWSKAWFRLGAAFEGSEKLTDAVTAYTRAASLCAGTEQKHVLAAVLRCEATLRAAERACMDVESKALETPATVLVPPRARPSEEDDFCAADVLANERAYRRARSALPFMSQKQLARRARVLRRLQRGTHAPGESDGEALGDDDGDDGSESDVSDSLLEDDLAAAGDFGADDGLLASEEAAASADAAAASDGGAPPVPRPPKRFSLVDEYGRRHPRADAVKRAWNLVAVHETGDGVDRCVWCECNGARWTQAVQRVDVQVLRKPLNIRAGDCAVRIGARSLKCWHRATGEVWLEGTLSADVVVSESHWFVIDGKLEIFLAKNPAAVHAGHVSDGNWKRLFRDDDELSDADMDDDRTDLDDTRRRQDKLAQLQASEVAKLELAKRQVVEDAAEEWQWVQTKELGAIEPSYAVPGQIGFDQKVDRDRVLQHCLGA